MRLKLLLDMNLSPDFAAYLRGQGMDARHWTECGKSDASDSDIMMYADEYGYTVITLDLDFGAILVATQNVRPSVIQIRAKEATSEKIQAFTLTAILQTVEELQNGAILTFDTEKARIRMLPIK